LPLGAGTAELPFANKVLGGEYCWIVSSLRLWVERRLTITGVDGTTLAEMVLMRWTHRLADEDYEAVGEPYAARQLPGVGLKGKEVRRNARERKRY
jgi:hypothetical protein